MLSRIESAPSIRMPCCVLVARWVVSQLDPTVDPVAADWAADVGRCVSIVGLDAWRGLVVSGDDVWSCPDTAARLLGGRVAWYPSVSPSTSVQLGQGVHVVQRWRGLEGSDTAAAGDDSFRPGASGHAYLVEREGDAVRVVQSSTAAGVRSSLGSWRRDGWLSGYAVRVASVGRGR